MTKIFISHESKDTDIARSLARLIAPFGYSVINQKSFLGEDWRALIAEGVREADLVLFIFDQKSKYSYFEFGYALGLKKPSVILTDLISEIPTSLGNVACVRLENLRQLDPYKIVAALDALRERVERHNRSRLGGTGPIGQVTQLAEMNVVDFERSIANWFSSQGFLVEHAGPQNLGFDLIVHDRKKNLKYVVELKNFTKGRLVTLHDVRRLLDAAVRTNSHGGIFVSTSDFTTSAREFSERVGLPILLWRTDEVGDWKMMLSDN
ncbi:MAG: restriction endonuclease [Pseudolabrys sp.]|nr:restriction endonuclease [Pseudolabrys sp.]